MMPLAVSCIVPFRSNSKKEGCCPYTFEYGVMTCEVFIGVEQKQTRRLRDCAAAARCGPVEWPRSCFEAALLGWAEPTLLARVVRKVVAGRTVSTSLLRLMG